MSVSISMMDGARQVPKRFSTAWSMISRLSEPLMLALTTACHV